MKFLRHFLFTLALVPLLLFTGCVTTGTNASGPKKSAQEIAQEIYERDGPLIQAGISLVVTGIEQFGTDNPQKLAQLQVDVADMCDKILRAVTIAESTTSGTVTPKQLCELLKVKEAYVARILQALVPIYSAEYAKIKDAD